jgi:hypothetical protein
MSDERGRPVERQQRHDGTRGKVVQQVGLDIEQQAEPIGG